MILVLLLLWETLKEQGRIKKLIAMQTFELAGASLPPIQLFMRKDNFIFVFLCP